MSAKTPALSVTPHPLGKPGGPGLYHIKGESLDPYIENIAAKLMKVNPSWDKSHAIAVAINMVKRLAATSKHAEVKAAAAKAIANLSKSQAKAKATPNLSNSVDLANAKSGKVYHFKHGWIPLGHPAAGEAKAHSADLIHKAEIMHGSDRSKWSVTNLKAAIKHGDTRAAVALSKKSKKKTNLANEVELAALLMSSDGKQRAVDDPAILTIHRKLCASGVRPQIAMKMAIKARNKKKAKKKVGLANNVGNSTTLKAEKYTARHGTNVEKSRAMSRLKTRGAIGDNKSTKAKDEGNSGSFDTKHARAPKGSPAGGQFVAMGAARNQASANKSGSQGVAARTEYKDAMTGKTDVTKLDDRKLGLLSRAAYSFKSDNPAVVKLRDKIAAELAKRGYDVKKFGALGGGIKSNKAMATPKKTKTAGKESSR